MVSWIFSREKKFISSLKNIIGFYPGNISVYKLAFSHRSLGKEEGGIKLSNERLEYLGDAVLGAVVADMLFKKFPLREEGFLTEMRSKIVSRDHLKQLAFKLGIDQFVKKMGGSDSFRSVYGDALEALIGAIYIDKGYTKTKKFILQHLINNHVDIDSLEASDTNFKSKILNWAQRNKHSVLFETLEENKSTKLIKVRLVVNDKEISQGIDYIKKKAEQIAAEKACVLLGINEI
jgi:ribonuclease-3